MLRLALILGGLGFASVFAVALLVGGIYLIATGHPSGGYALAGASALTGIVAMALVLAAVLRVNKGERWNWNGLRAARESTSSTYYSEDTFLR